jgi:carboxypeptidase D
MEVGPFRVVPAAQTASGKVEVKMVEGGWEEFATIVFSELNVSPYVHGQMYLTRKVDQPPGTGLSYVPTNGYLHELDQVNEEIIA